jgi:hypothetical protein
VTPAPPPVAPATPEQVVYGRGLRAATRVGFVVLVAAFAAYVTGILPAHVPLAQLPQFWQLTAAQYRAAAGIAPGWGWLAQVAQGEFASLAGIAILAGGSLASLGAVAVLFRRRGDRVYALLSLALMAVILVAASGLLNRLH